MRLKHLFIVPMLLGIAVIYYHHPITAYLSGLQGKLELRERQTKLAEIESRLNTMQTDLRKFLSDHPSLARLRVALIHEAGPGNEHLLWDIVAVVAAPGHAMGDVRINMPITLWGNYLQNYLNHECVAGNINTVQNNLTLSYMLSNKVTGFLACPIETESGELLGLLGASWDSLSDIPADLGPTEQSLRATAQRLAQLIPSHGMR